MIGSVFVTPHARRRWRQRINPQASDDQALVEILEAWQHCTLRRTDEDGTQHWRARSGCRFGHLRFRVRPGLGPLPAIMTVLPEHGDFVPARRPEPDRNFSVRSTDGYAPLRVTARMDEPIAYLGDMLHLDGPLAYAAYHDLDERTRKTIAPIETTDWPIDVMLPVSTWWADYSPSAHGDVDPRLCGTNGDAQQFWGWCCSAADESAWGARSKIEVRKKPALREMGRYTDAKSANLSSGHMKAYDLAIPTVLALEVVWYAHGDADKIRALLQRFVPALGKKRSTGNGTVREWVVEQAEHDWSVIGADGQLTRRMPFGAAPGSARYGAIRPPYYHATRVVMAVEPC